MSRLARSDSNPTSPTTFAPLRNRTFRSIWLATQVSNLATLMQTVAIAWLMATIATNDLMVALVQASSALPGFILSAFVGAIADNFNRRRVMIAAQCLMAVASAIFTALVALGLVDPWSILGFSFLLGCSTALNNPARQASIGDIVDRRDLPAAVMLHSVGFNTARSVGPALGGIILASFGPLTAVALNTLSYVAPLCAIWRCKWKVPSSPFPPEPMTMAIYDGMRFTVMSSDIKAAVARGFLFGFAGISLLALLPLVVRDQLTRGPIAYGILMAGFGTGAFFGGISTGHFRRIMSQEQLIVLACLACAACSICLALRPPLAIAATAMGLGGAGWVIAWSGLDVCVQLASPRWIVGRILSIHYALTYGGIAAGSWMWGVMVQNYSLSWAQACSAGALLLVAAAGFLLPVRDSRNPNLDPLEESPPAVALALKPRSGPIVVNIEYLISESNVDNFLGLMRERRRMRSRVGARYWALLRDLQISSQWTETFRTPTWTDYLRLNHRLTTADKQLDERLLELHTGPHPPQTRLSIERPIGPVRNPVQSTPFLSHH
ncbi:MFS transporter [Bradyrhizobium sp. UFLA05-112]